ncbi:ATP-binding cassette domain-containing protein [Kitasatospora aureofaciens]|uniref:ATP-binding cassette domain-containing protein n=1 Tax=Kitasatospora aureofaciens TaxID=1894 RepID=UPI001DA9BBCD|nr:ATP-binding cassette domain-containing protein [Kitasatospora aureofaciens]HJD81688.1 ATP-binding cassette domain-containing protein [Kitasatospora aureofaciens]
MIQITGLTKVRHKGAPPIVLDVTFDARPGMVTVLLGDEGAGKSTALRLMLELERGQGVTLFDGRPYRRIRRPERQIGVLLSGPGGGATAVAGNPGRKARGHLRMLAAAVGVPVRRADELLEQTRLSAVAEQRLRTFSPGMHRRLALAAALLGDPGTLLLDAPTEGLSPRNVEWFHSFLRSFAVAGGTVLVTTRTPREAAQLADRVVTLDRGRLVADQPVAEFCRTRLSPEVAVRGPQMARLADMLVSQGARVRPDGGAGLAVAGIDRTEIGELAYRNGILLHELADRVVEQPVPRAAPPVTSGHSGHLGLQRDSEAAHETAQEMAHASAHTSVTEATPPTPEPSATPAPLPTLPDRPASAVPTVPEPATEGRARDDAAVRPTRALPVAAVTAVLPALTAAPQADHAPAVDRLLRNQLTPAARPTPAPEPARTEPARTEPARTEPVRSEAARSEHARTEAVRSEAAPTQPSQYRESAADLLSDDTVRLGRVAAGKTPATPDDHRSE